MAQQTTVYTIGHGDRDFDTVVAQFAAHHVQTLIDVRSTPYSRHAPDFQKDVLAGYCADAGLGYRWLGDRLGGCGEVQVEAFDAAITEVLGLAEASRIALLCSEIDPRFCHRSRQLAPALIARGCHVMHIVGDATTPHQHDLGL